MASFFNVGKYEVRAWAFVHMRPEGRCMHGFWTVTDTNSESGEPVAEGECKIDRTSDGEALDDAMTAGRQAAEKLRKKDGG